MEDKYSYLVDSSAKFLCRFMMRDSEFLKYRSSCIGAAAFLMSLNANTETPLAKKIEARVLSLEEIDMESFFQDRTIKIRING